MSAVGLLALLINILIFALIFYVLVWVLEIIFGPIPAKIRQIIMAIFGLVIVLWLLQYLIGGGAPMILRLR